MASSIVKSASQQVGNLLVEEAKFLYKVHDKIETMQTELEWIECFLEDADNRQHQEKLVRKWVAQITDFAYEAEDIIERYLHEVCNQRRDGIWDTIKWFSNILCTCRVSTLHNLGLDIDELIVKISELNKRMKRYGIQFMRPMESLPYNAMMREQRRTYWHVKEEVVGLEKDVQQVVAQLLKDQVNVVSVIGMGGLGKSTLARKVFVDNTIKEHFRNNCVWVYLSKEFSRRNAFEEILIGLSATGKDGDANKNIKELTDDELPQKIYELLQNRNCFVVLDDIWSTEAWDSLEPALGSIEGSLSKILLTTRNHGLQQHVDSNGYSHHLEPLNDENSWKLLQLKAFPQRRAGTLAVFWRQ